MASPQTLLTSQRVVADATRFPEVELQPFVLPVDRRGSDLAAKCSPSGWIVVDAWLMPWDAFGCLELCRLWGPPWLLESLVKLWVTRVFAHDQDSRSRAGSLMAHIAIAMADNKPPRSFCVYHKLAGDLPLNINKIIIYMDLTWSNITCFCLRLIDHRKATACDSMINASSISIDQRGVVY